MNLNATKRPFGHFDVNVLKLGNSEKKYVICIFEITMYLYAHNIGSTNKCI